MIAVLLAILNIVLVAVCVLGFFIGIAYAIKVMFNPKHEEYHNDAD